ncbi:hypothetical protein [Roseovarius dicentrarchi]|uniref:hypothetical protein n=1 Tax=Roseovarius dicentrarchi TaxID=2250573 RepID=UPI000DE8233C|nr:hypothetical protein [Roseovarius dicentrarchi]
MGNKPNNNLKLAPGVRVIIRAFDDISEHAFLIDEVHDDCVCGQALTGPLSGAYGEPEIEMILRVID